MRYHRGLMNAILGDRVEIAKAVNATVITLDEAPQGYKDFDSGVAKKFIHDYCNTHNCRGSRIRDCESKTQFRVDCEGIYGRGRKDVCTFKVSVQAVKNKQIRINIIRKSITCEDG